MHSAEIESLVAAGISPDAIAVLFMLGIGLVSTLWAIRHIMLSHEKAIKLLTDSNKEYLTQVTSTYKETLQAFRHDLTKL